jgi:HSP20 family protein
MKKRSFFDRLAGTEQRYGNERYDRYDSFEDEPAGPRRAEDAYPVEAPARSPLERLEEESQGEGQLPVDVHQTPNEIVIRTFVAGVRPDELNVSISRDMVVIDGARDERDSISEGDYFTRELFWGSFSRTILLPQEIDVDASVATSKDGLLTLVLPKLDKARQTKLRIKAG